MYNYTNTRRIIRSTYYTWAIKPPPFMDRKAMDKGLVNIHRTSIDNTDVLFIYYDKNLLWSIMIWLILLDYLNLFSTKSNGRKLE